jgi:DNA-binding CsgD family transcriptional regulator
MITRDPRGVRDPSSCEAELAARCYDVYELMVNGATIRQVADHFGISRSLVQADLARVAVEMNAQGHERALVLREEIIARQRALIFANMPRAKAGDKTSAQIVQHADALIATVAGLRYLRPMEPLEPPVADSPISDAVAAYVKGIMDATPATVR